MEFPDVTAVDILLSGWMKSESPPHEVLARILDAAVCVKKHEDQHRRKTRDLWTRTARCIEFAGVIWEHLL